MNTHTHIVRGSESNICGGKSGSTHLYPFVLMLEHISQHEDDVDAFVFACSLFPLPHGRRLRWKQATAALPARRGGERRSERARRRERRRDDAAVAREETVR